MKNSLADHRSWPDPVDLQLGSIGQIRHEKMTKVQPGGVLGEFGCPVCKGVNWLERLWVISA